MVLVGHSNNETSIIDNLQIGNDIAIFYTLENGIVIKKNTLGDIGFDQGNDLIYDDNGRLIVIGSTENNLEGISKDNPNTDVIIAFWH